MILPAPGQRVFKWPIKPKPNTYNTGTIRRDRSFLRNALSTIAKDS